MRGTEREQFLEAFGGLYVYKKRAAKLSGYHGVSFAILTAGMARAGIPFTKEGHPIFNGYRGDGSFVTDWVTEGGEKRSRVEHIPWGRADLDAGMIWPDWYGILLKNSRPFKEACQDLYPDRLQLEVYLVTAAGGNGRANPQMLDRELSLRREIIFPID